MMTHVVQFQRLQIWQIKAKVGQTTAKEIEITGDYFTAFYYLPLTNLTI